MIAAEDDRYRRVAVMQATVDAVRNALDRGDGPKLLTSEEIMALSEAPPEKQKKEHPDPLKKEVVIPQGSILAKADLSLELSRKAYETRLEDLQDQLRELQFRCYAQRRAVVLVMEGWDAGGKGGAIKRLTVKLDPRGYEVIPISAPTDEEKAHHYLWRFWRRVPKDGHLAVFDRSWYGRLLVERVEKFATPEQWRRAFHEINDFERAITDHGSVLCKFWLQISPEEQLRRFRAREVTPRKMFKLTDEDWRNRAKWQDYTNAVVDMLEQTSTPWGPWTVVEANDKLWARVKVLETVAKAIEASLAEGKKSKQL
jgi:polyphosphate kinase 2 (PPK2 family)